MKYLKEQVTVWPNPVHGKLFVNIVNDNASPAVIKIFNSNGSLVKTVKADLLNGTNQLIVDMTGFPNGIYSALIVWNNGSVKRWYK